jgi:DNA-3-methyladenine glycosylase II
VARVSYGAAATELARRDPVMARLVQAAGPPRLRPPVDSHFAALVRAIVFQQLAGSAALAIHGRLVTLLEGQVTPVRVLAQPDESLRGVGLSTSKAASIVDLATKALDGTVLIDTPRLARKSDDEIIDRLTTVRGIGRWTAEMFLLFQLRRLDVWPVGDLGVRKGYSLAYGVALPSPAKLAELGDAFVPFRSIAAWYCWRAVDLERGPVVRG